jgi:uncharacterized membrane protein
VLVVVLAVATGALTAVSGPVELTVVVADPPHDPISAAARRPPAIARHRRIVRVSQAAPMEQSHHSLAARLARHDPFWAPQLVVAAALALDLSLSKKVTVGPTWLLPAVEGLLLLGLVLASPHPWLRHSPVRRRVAMTLIGIVSAVNLVSLVLLSHFLLNHSGYSKREGHDLILSGIVLWATNVLLFGLWYWELDRGGPIERATNPDSTPDFLFPQMTDPRYAPPGWAPSLIDYLYVSFTNASAFSPTDTMPLSPSTKVLMSAQALGSLITVGLVVARAVNILA